MAKNWAKFFTKKVALIVLAAVVAVGGVIWAIVANAQPKFRSGIKDVPLAEYVSGNGTASVMVDDYLYFVGDSIATEAIKYGDNEYYADGKMPDTGIYRVKIENGAPVVDYEYDNTSTNDAGEKIELQEGDKGYNTKVVGVSNWEHIGEKGNKIEAVVPKIAGHNKTAMWVFGKYLIYVSPHNRLDNRGNPLSDYLDFYRVDLDGKNHTLIYTSDSSDLTTNNFTVWADSIDNINLLIYETVDSKTQIKKINVKTKKVTVLDSDVSNVVLPTATQYRNTKNHPNETLEKVYSGVMSYVYYTKAHNNSSIVGNQLWRCSIDSGEATQIVSNGNSEKGTTFTPLAVTPLQNGNTQFVFSAVVTYNSTTFQQPLIYVITDQTLDNYQYVELKENEQKWGLQESYAIKVYANGFCTVNNSLWHYDIKDSRIDGQKDLNLSVDTVLAVIDNYIYIQNSAGVTKVSVDGTKTPIMTGSSASSSDDTGTGSDDDETTTTSKPTLPMAILYHTYRDTGDHMIFVQDDTTIRLCNTDGKVNYLKFK